MEFETGSNEQENTESVDERRVRQAKQSTYSKRIRGSRLWTDERTIERLSNFAVDLERRALRLLKRCRDIITCMKNAFFC